VTQSNARQSGDFTNSGRATDPASRRQTEEPRSTEEEAAQTEQGLGTSYMQRGATEQSRQRWQEIQARFVDDPRKAVAEAHGLVSEVMEGIVKRFQSERGELEQRWSSGENVSTEDLRRSLQRYRDFFGRLLSKLD